MSDEVVGSVLRAVEYGVSRVIISTHPEKRYAVVFEDDEDTGYVYALDQLRDDNPICDAALIYQGQSGGEFALEIFWHPTRATAAVMGDNTPQCVIDFESEQMWCRSGFPPPAPDWLKNDKQWSDDCLDLFRAGES